MFDLSQSLARGSPGSNIPVPHRLVIELERAYLGEAGNRTRDQFYAEFEVLVGVSMLGRESKSSHGFLRYAFSELAFCWIRITTNSAGLRGANPTKMLTMP
jgi:hypothetical protein